MGQKVKLPKSNVIGKTPSANTMEFGELYVNYASGSGNSFLVTKKSDGSLAKFPESASVVNALSKKVDKVANKGLSTNDYTTAEKNKLAGIAEGAEINVQSDWNQTDNTADDYIKNTPDIQSSTILRVYRSLTGTPVITTSPYNHAKWDVTDSTITEYVDGMVVCLKVPVAGHGTYGTGFQINNLGYKPVVYNVNSMVSTRYSVDSVIWCVYNETQTATLYKNSANASTITGCWQVMDYSVSNTDTIGYQLRTGSSTRKPTNGVGRYRLLFSSVDNLNWVPANTDSGNITSSTTKTVNQTKINPFGRIVYYSSTGAVKTTSAVAAKYAWDQYNIALGYSFNTTNTNLTLTYPAPVYIKCTPQADGSAIIDPTTPYVQTLPSTDDGKIYIYLGMAYNATNIELEEKHPVFYHDGTGIRVWTGKRPFSGNYDDLFNKPTIPTVNNSTITIQKNGSTVKSFTLNQSNNDTINITVPTSLTGLTNDAGFITSAVTSLQNYATSANVVSALNTKVDKVTGKGLSSNDYTNDEKDKLAGIASGAEVNVQSDWNATSGDAFIKNKPTIPTVNNNTITIQKNGTNVDSFTLNQASNKTINIPIPTNVNELTNGSGFITSGVTAMTNYATSANVVTALNKKPDAAFTTIAIGATNIVADSSADTLTITAGNNITLTPNSTNDSITIAATNTTYTAATATPMTVTSATGVVGTSDRYAREDHKHQLTLATGDANGQVKIGGTNVNVKGLASAAYTESSTYVPTGRTVNGKNLGSNITLSASDVSALTNTTKYAASIALTQNETNFQYTWQLKDQDGNNLGTAQTLDLPIDFFDCVMTEENGVWSCDKNWLEIYNAHINGKQIRLKHDSDIYIPILIQGTMAYFGYTATINEEGTILVISNAFIFDLNGELFSAGWSHQEIVSTTFSLSDKAKLDYIDAANYIDSGVTAMTNYATSADVVTALNNKVDDSDVVKFYGPFNNRPNEYYCSHLVNDIISKVEDKESFPISFIDANGFVWQADHIVCNNDKVTIYFKTPELSNVKLPNYLVHDYYISANTTFNLSTGTGYQGAKSMWYGHNLSYGAISTLKINDLLSGSPENGNLITYTANNNSSAWTPVGRNSVIMSVNGTNHNFIGISTDEGNALKYIPINTEYYCDGYFTNVSSAITLELGKYYNGYSEMRLINMTGQTNFNFSISDHNEHILLIKNTTNADEEFSINSVVFYDMVNDSSFTPSYISKPKGKLTIPSSGCAEVSIIYAGNIAAFSWRDDITIS